MDNNIDSLDDLFLKNNIRKLPIDRTSVDFTSSLMNQVYASVEPAIEPQLYRKQMLWAYGSIGAGIIVIALILFALWPFFNFNVKIDSSLILLLINSSLKAMNKVLNFISYLRESSLQLTIFFSVFILFLAERFFRRSFSKSNSFIL